MRIHCVSMLIPVSHSLLIFFFFNDTATTEIYTLSLHDALPIASAARRLHPALLLHQSHGGRAAGGLPGGALAARGQGADGQALHGLRGRPALLPQGLRSQGSGLRPRAAWRFTRASRDGRRASE